jgi:MoxR-like ATPase
VVTVTAHDDAALRTVGPSEAPAGREPGRPVPFAELFRRITDNVEAVVRGKPDVVRLAVVCLVADGHLLVEDTPGVGKTTLAKALASSVDCTFGRIQFTPDLLPADVVGLSIWNRTTGGFDFRPGPVFSNIVLGDEINRASPKTQSALLEAMAERQVTVDGTTHRLGSPFMVLATQNPIDHEGTYPLPESQLDRFLMRLSIGYPDRAAELEILETHGSSEEPVDALGPVVSRADLSGMAAAATGVHLAAPLRGYLVDLADATRRHPALRAGVSTRATVALQRATRVLAASHGRGYATPDDVKALAPSVLAHRLIVTPEAQLQGITPEQVLDDLIRVIPAPSAAG